MEKLIAITLVGFLLLGSGCGGEPPKPPKVPIPPPVKKDGKEPSAPVKAPTTAVPSKPSVPAEEKTGSPVILVYNYNPQGKIDPFKPLIRDVEAPKAPPPQPPPPPNDKGEKTPLERFDLKDLKLVAIVWGIPDPRALVETSKGEGFILKVGIPIGKNRGLVTKIEPKGVEVTEKEWIEGKFKNVIRMLKLYEE